VEDILDLGRIEGSAFQLNCDEFKIGEVIMEVVDIFEIELRHKKIKFNVNISQRFQLVNVYSDRDRLRQVIINLVSNAIKFCNSMIKVDWFQLFGESESESSHEEKKDTAIYAFPNFDPKTAAKNLAKKRELLFASDSVFISVTDDGEGIPPQDQEKLFKLFGKIQKTHHRNKKGCGLGLTVCKKIMQKMKGDINVISKKHRGTIFCCMFKSTNLDFESKNYDESLEYMEDVRASLIYSSHVRGSKTL
jgi:signal transduction histidine kinase